MRLGDHVDERRARPARSAVKRDRRGRAERAIGRLAAAVGEIERDVVGLDVQQLGAGTGVVAGEIGNGHGALVTHFDTGLWRHFVRTYEPAVSEARLLGSLSWLASVSTLVAWRLAKRSPDFELPDQDGYAASALDAAGRRPGRAVLLPGGDDAPVARRRPATSAIWRPSSPPPACSGSASAATRSTSRSSSRDKHSFDYPLLSDSDGAVAETFGVKRGKLGARLGAPVKRWTFAIGTDRQVVAAIHSELNMDTHADQALAALRRR